MRFLLLATILMVVPVATHGVPVEWPEADGGNGHFYEVIDASSTWFTAETAAGMMTHGNSTGYLATVTSQDEWDFLVNSFVIPESNGYWIGGYQPEDSPEPGGGWTWITGEPWDFTVWRPGEPNNSGNEDGLEIRTSGWNDHVRSVMRSGYVVEYGGYVTPVGNQVNSITMLFSSVPNPFNPTTDISFEIPAASHARLTVFDVAGRHVQTLLDKRCAAGRHTVTWDGRDHAGYSLASGTYLYRLEAGDYVSMKRMTLLK